jgi:hypothetical protein
MSVYMRRGFISSWSFGIQWNLGRKKVNESNPLCVSQIQDEVRDGSAAESSWLVQPPLHEDG